MARKAGRLYSINNMHINLRVLLWDVLLTCCTCATLQFKSTRQNVKDQSRGNILRNTPFFGFMVSPTIVCIGNNTMYG